MKSGLTVFLGPSLPWAEARKVAPGAVLLPPARQGDVWRALEARPRAIALIDGVFESQPSVWHHELLDALDSGVAVFGAASMGALRAVELGSFGMIGVGRICGWLRDGTIRDDAEVALLHATAEHDFRALTLPLVNVRAAALAARSSRVLSAVQARALVVCAEEIFYQERTWPKLLAAQGWSARIRAGWDAFAGAGLPDQKADDARECLREASRFAAASIALPVRPRQPSASSLVRRRRLAMSGNRAGARRGRAVSRESPRADLETEAGLRRLLLAGWARSSGLRPLERDLQAARLLVRTGKDPAQAERLAEDLALERLALRYAERLLPDGPSMEEAAESQALLKPRMRKR